MENKIILPWPDWEIEKLLGRGSFGEVYQIVKEELGTQIRAAVKIMRIPANSSEVDQLEDSGISAESYLSGMVSDITNEIVVMQTLKGAPNIVSIDDYEIVKNSERLQWTIYIRMELLTDLNKYRRKNALTYEQAIRMGCDVCNALEICRRRNVIHRDIKPSNIFISQFGEFKLGDFGISKHTENTQSAFSTRKGTYSYMAPEVYKGERYDYSIDLYSLGVVLYQMTNNGRLPFYPPAGTNVMPGDAEQAQQKRNSGVPFPDPANGGRKLGNILRKACNIDPQKRYHSPASMREDLKNLITNVDNIRIEIGNSDERLKRRTEKEKQERTAGKQREEETIPSFDSEKYVKKNERIKENEKKNKETKREKNHYKTIIVSVALLLGITSIGVFVLKNRNTLLPVGLVKKEAEPNLETGTKGRETIAAESKEEKMTEAVAETETAKALAVTETERLTESVPQTETETEKAVEVITETETERITEGATETETERITEAVTETGAEKITETITETETEKITEAATETETEKTTEVATETETEKVTENDIGKASFNVPSGTHYKAALLLAGNLGDMSVCDSANEGLTRLRDDLGTDKFDFTVVQMGEMASDESKWEPTLLDYCDSGEYDVIIVGGWQMLQALEEASAEYPDQKFMLFDEPFDFAGSGNSDNVYNILYRQDEVSYLVGAAAAMMTTDADLEGINPENHMIGFIGGMDTNEVEDYLIGYIQGALEVDSEIEVAVDFVGDFIDSTKGKEIALSQQQMGVDVGFSAAENAGLGQIEAAEDNGGYAFGIDADQAAMLMDYADHIPTSAVKNVGQSLYLAIQKDMLGELTYGTTETYGLKEGAVELIKDSHYEEMLPKDIRSRLDAMEQSIINGDIVVNSAYGMSQEEIETLEESVKPGREHLNGETETEKQTETQKVTEAEKQTEVEKESAAETQTEERSADILDADAQRSEQKKIRLEKQFQCFVGSEVEGTEEREGYITECKTDFSIDTVDVYEGAGDTIVSTAYDMSDGELYVDVYAESGLFHIRFKTKDMAKQLDYYNIPLGADASEVEFHEENDYTYVSCLDRDGNNLAYMEQYKVKTFNKATKRYVITGAGLNVRKQPDNNQNGEVIAKLSVGDEIEVCGWAKGWINKEESDWYLIRLEKEGYGYISANADYTTDNKALADQKVSEIKAAQAAAAATPQYSGGGNSGGNSGGDNSRKPSGGGVVISDW